MDVEHPAGDQSGRIDHDGGKLVWRQVADLLRKQLGGMAVGQMLPSVRTLMQAYGVSDGTVKRARAHGWAPATRAQARVPPSAGRGRRPGP